MGLGHRLHVLGPGALGQLPQGEGYLFIQRLHIRRLAGIGGTLDGGEKILFLLHRLLTGGGLGGLLGGEHLGDGGVPPELLPLLQQVPDVTAGGLLDGLLGADQQSLGVTVPGDLELVGAFGAVALAETPVALEDGEEDDGQQQKGGGQLGCEGIHSATSPARPRRAMSSAAWRSAPSSGKRSISSQWIPSSRRNQVSCRLA